jgi:hypothetical protein
LIKFPFWLAGANAIWFHGIRNRRYKQRPPTHRSHAADGKVRGARPQEPVLPHRRARVPPPPVGADLLDNLQGDSPRLEEGGGGRGRGGGMCVCGGVDSTPWFTLRGSAAPRPRLRVPFIIPSHHRGGGMEPDRARHQDRLRLRHQDRRADWGGGQGVKGSTPAAYPPAPRNVATATLRMMAAAAPCTRWPLRLCRERLHRAQCLLAVRCGVCT